MTPTERNAAINHLLATLKPDELSQVYDLMQSSGWPTKHHFSLGILVRNILRQKFDWPDHILDDEWASLVAEAARRHVEDKPKRHSLPDLPPRLKSAVLAAAENFTAIAHSEGIELTDHKGEASPHLVSLLYHLRDHCKEAEQEPQPWLGDQTITLREIATVLETITQILISDETYDFAGRNPSWFSDAATLIERVAQELKRR